jgi:hypothetical protein
MQEKISKLNIDDRVARCEARKPVTRKDKEMMQSNYEKAQLSGKKAQDIYSYITEADRVRLSY